MPGRNHWEFKLCPVKEGILVGHELMVNWGESLHFNHSFSMPQHFNRIIKNNNNGSVHCGKGQRQFLRIKSFVPTATAELSVPSFMPPCKVSKSIVTIHVVSNQDTLIDCHITVLYESGDFMFQDKSAKAWLDDECEGVTTTTRLFLPISVEMQTGYFFDIENNEEKDNGNYDSSQKKNGSSTSSQASVDAIVIRFEKPILPESVVKMKLEMIAKQDIWKTKTTVNDKLNLTVRVLTN